jgi:hypothetical protein
VIIERRVGIWLGGGVFAHFGKKVKSDRKKSIHAALMQRAY